MGNEASDFAPSALERRRIPDRPGGAALEHEDG
jgi:hypothetical protein